MCSHPVSPLAVTIWQMMFWLGEKLKLYSHEINLSLIHSVGNQGWFWADVSSKTIMSFIIELLYFGHSTWSRGSRAAVRKAFNWTALRSQNPFSRWAWLDWNLISTNAVWKPSDISYLISIIIRNIHIYTYLRTQNQDDILLCVAKMF